MAAATLARTFDSHWIGGQWLPAETERGIDVINPSDESLLGIVPAGTATDVQRAVTAAGQAFPRWRRGALAE